MILTLVGLYFGGMLIGWLRWRENLMTDWWFQNAVTLIFWPVFAVIIPLIIFSKRNDR